jgi:phage terminase large subunit-like protein
MFHRLRLGTHPQGLLTTTPKRLSLLHKLVKDPSTVITRGSTMDNAANLPAAWLQKMLDDYGQTTLGRQELWGELFENLPGALWQQGWIDGARISQAPDKPGEVLELLAAKGVKIRRIVVGLDPATTSKEESDACGICVAALGTVDGKDHGYVLEDATERASPDAWGRRVVDLVRKWRADCVVAETTMGGETIPAIIRLIDDKIKTIEKGGNRGKKTRAEPVAALYEQGRIHHVGMFTALEDQMCQYTLDTKKSPNNLDAAVYALGELLLHGGPGYFAAI